MKLKFKLLLVFVAYISLMFFTFSCKNTASTLEIAQTNQSVLDNGLSIANAQYLAEFENFKLEVDLITQENDSLMADFKISLIKESKEGNPYYRKQIRDIEEANLELENKLNNYQPIGKIEWENFKDSIDMDLTELKLKHKNLTVKKA